MTAAPKFATRPTPGAIHDGASIARLAHVLHRPLMPWQVLVARVGTERHPADPRRYRYREVRVSVPRQSGKTTLAHVKNCHRCIGQADHQVFYTAQTGKDARERWLDALAIVERSPLGRFVADGNPYGGAVRRGAGATAIVWPNGSQLRPFAPTAASLHGYTPDTVDEDEVWAYDVLQGQALDGAIGPAQITLPHAQRWRFSTMGDADSFYWHQLVDEGRAATDDPDATVAYFEWSADDGEGWADFHPAVGYTIQADDLDAEAAKAPPGMVERAFRNRRTSARETVLDVDAWDALGDPELTIGTTGAALAYDVAHDQSQATLVLAQPGATDDTVAGRVLLSRPGMAWLEDAVVNQLRHLGLAVVHADDGGPAREVTDSLRRRGFTVETTGASAYATACGAVMRRTKDGRLRHDGSAVLREAVAAARTRPMGDAVAFSRRQSAGPVDALVAYAVAIRAALLAPAPAPAPMIRGLA